MRKLAAIWLALVALEAVAAPLLSPNDPAVTFRAFLYAPPMRPHVVGPDGAWRRPFVHPLRLVSRLEQTYDEDVSRAVPLEFFAGGKLARLSDESAGPWLPLGADRDGRDVLARLLFGARTSLGVALLATLTALLLGLVAEAWPATGAASWTTR